MLRLPSSGIFLLAGSARWVTLLTSLVMGVLSQGRFKPKRFLLAEHLRSALCLKLESIR